MKTNAKIAHGLYLKIKNDLDKIRPDNPEQITYIASHVDNMICIHLSLNLGVKKQPEKPNLNNC